MEELITQSLVQYRRMLEELTRIDGMLKSGRAAAIGPVLENWLRLQQEARQTDEMIAEFGEGNPEPVLSSPSHEARILLMKTLAERCREVFGNAVTHKALIREELTALRGGRRAISGYKSMPARTGKQICSRQ
jgi:hypothetical protein